MIRASRIQHRASSIEHRFTHLRFRWIRGRGVLGRAVGFCRAWRQSERSCPGIAHLRFVRAPAGSSAPCRSIGCWRPAPDFTSWLALTTTFWLIRWFFRSIIFSIISIFSFSQVSNAGYISRNYALNSLNEKSICLFIT